MKGNNSLVPRLRFKEFSGEWKEKKLGDIGFLLKGKGISKADIDEDGALECIRYGELYTHYNEVIRDVLSRTNVSPKELVLSQNNDVIIPASGETQEDIATASCILKEGVALGGDLNIIRTDLNGVFLAYYLNNAKKRDIASMSQGVSVIHLYPNQLKSLMIHTPQKEEQQKIADTLSSLDILIENEQAKLAQLQEHKKGLMQNLFPQEGESIPKVRFKEFENDGEWEEKELGALIDIKGRIGYRGYTLKDIVDKGEGAISMSPSNIDDNQTLSFEKSTYITWDKYYESPEIILKDGYTVLVKTGSSYGKVAFIKDLIEKTTINPQLVVLKPEKMVDYFLFLLIASSTVQELINQTVVGGAIPTLSQKSISEFEVFVPSLNEQQRIADTLSSLNNLISAQTERIELLQQHKKGLIQGLFPNKNKYE